MPEKMQLMTLRMIEHNWLLSYRELSSIGLALDGVSKRIRFDNDLLGAIEEVQDNYLVYQQAFDDFFPQLMAFVKDNKEAQL